MGFIKGVFSGILGIFVYSNKLLSVASVLDGLGILFLRIVTGVMMLGHGITKLNNFDAQIVSIQQMLAGAGMPLWFAYLVVIGEVIAPIMIILGIFTRLGALILTINMLFIIYLAHGGALFAMSNHGFAAELPYLFLALSVYLLIVGSGRFALVPKDYR